MQTALPNLHPVVVHLPLVLLPAAVVFDLAGVAVRKPALDRVGAGLWAAAALTLLGAYVAGRWAADGLVAVPPQAQAALAAHADAAWWLLIGATVVALGRAGLAALVPPDAPRGWLPRLGLALAGVGLAGWMAVTADRGGALVYSHGLAVAGLPCPAPEPAAPVPPAEAPAETAGSRLVTGPDGSVTWTPSSGDWAARGSVFASDGAGRVEEIAQQGLLIRVDGRRRVLLPGAMGDVQVDATLDLASFDGEVGVLHHVGDGADDFGAFVVSTTGSARLLDSSPSDDVVLDTSDVEVPGKLTLSVNASGSHLKGMIDGRTVTHGHHPQRPDGRVGLLLDGSGVVRIERLEATPLGAP